MSRFASVSISVLLWAFATAGSAADSHYQLTDLGDLTADRTHGVTFASGINEHGDIVGQSFDDQLRARAFLWQRGRMIDLGDIGLLGSQPASLAALSVNNHAAVVGTAMGTGTSTQTRAFYWHLGLMLDLATLRGQGTDSFATGINNRGDVVGAGFRASGELHALRWILGIPLELGGVPDGRFAVQAFGVNDRGDIVGYLSPGTAVSFVHAFLLRNGQFTDLGTLPGTQLSFANALNERGQVVGQSLDPTVPDTGRAFLWDGGALLDLGVAAATHTRSEARSINKKGRVVGRSGAGLVSVAWVWDEGVIQDLNALIAPDDPNRPFVQLTTANGINDKGEIVAQGIDQRLGSTMVRGYLLTPVH
jgi:probable HAF family extracellular repeat protein